MQIARILHRVHLLGEVVEMPGLPGFPDGSVRRTACGIRLHVAAQVLNPETAQPCARCQLASSQRSAARYV